MRCDAVFVRSVMRFMGKGTVLGMNCCRCGKSFDYEKYNGICPKCAAYNRPQGEKPYDYDVDKDFSSHYEMDDSHAKLHRMYDSASAHQPEKQHAEYHRQYDNNYRHQPQGQNGVPAYRANPLQGGVLQGQNGVPAYRANPLQGGVLQGQNGVPAYRANPPHGGVPQGGMPQNGTYQMQGANGGNPPRGKERKGLVKKIVLIIILINVTFSLLQFILAFYG